MGALECVWSYQDTFKHVPASFGSLSLKLCKTEPVAPVHPCARDIPLILNITPAQHQTTCIYKRLIVQTLARSEGLSSSESSRCDLPETIDTRIGAKPRGCSSLCRDLERHGCRARAHKDVLVACPGISYCMALASPMINGFQPVSREVCKVLVSPMVIDPLALK